MNNEELKRVWNDEYSADHVIGQDIRTGRDITSLEGRQARNFHMVRDFWQHAWNRPSHGIVEVMTSCQTVVEIGAGTCDFIHALFISPDFIFSSGIAIDMSATALGKARHFYETGEWVMPDGKHIELRPGSFFDADVIKVKDGATYGADLVVANQVVEHFSNPHMVVDRMLELAKYALVIVPYKEPVEDFIPKSPIEGGSDHLSSFDESTFAEYNVVDDMVFFSKEGWGVSRKGECPLQYAILIKGND